MKISVFIKTGFFFGLLMPLLINAQDAFTDVPDEGIIHIKNGSFEDIPHKGQGGRIVKNWHDCGRSAFPHETPPDIHPGEFWENNLPASEGKTYLGMVVRNNESNESLSQRLEDNMAVGKCYVISMEVARSPRYVSATNANKEILENFTRPTVLRVWGGSGYCSQRQLLSETPPIDHSEWTTYNFEFKSKYPHRYVTIEAFYKTPMLVPYNGHVLVDNLSDFKMIPCPGEEIVAVAKPKKFIPPHKRKKETPKPKQKAKSGKKTDIVNAGPEKTSPKNKILKDLDRKTIRKGQTIRIEKLYFAADTSRIAENSFTVLDEIYEFLYENKNIKVEIGGHTNGTPSHEYCDKLSTDRAREVAGFLIKKGIPQKRIEFRGYGKRRPIASNKSKRGRIRNQRVEIKVLSVDS